MTPFAKIPVELLLDKSINRNEIRVYGAISSLEDKSIYISKIQDRCRIPISIIIECIDNLIKQGWLQSTKDESSYDVFKYKYKCLELRAGNTDD